METGGAQNSVRYPSLDGWRGISILLVLAAHLLPLGPKALQLNATAGPMGMSLFFTLSGFLITSFLLAKADVIDFLIRRFFRIIPLAVLYITVVLLLTKVDDVNKWLAHLLFYANWPPMQLGEATSHFWSLCVEIQFYVAIAILVAILGRRGLFLIPLICLSVTLFRVYDGVYIAINTYYRIDEILAGSVLALFYAKMGSSRSFMTFSVPWPVYFLTGVVFVLSCHPETGALNYIRPYLGAFLVGLTLYDNNKGGIRRILNSRILLYFAAISFALYVVHGGLAHTWLGEGDLLEKYLKRPLLFVVAILLAHFSTFYYEKKCIRFGKALSGYYQRRKISFVDNS